MILRGMHDHGCDDVYIIVTDVKKQEMDDITEYFKLVCRYAYGKKCKPSKESQIQYERPFLPCHPIYILASHLYTRYASHPHTSQTTPHAMFPPDRPHIPCHIVREAPTIHHFIFPPDDLVLSNFIHASAVRTSGRHLLRLSKWLSKSVLQRRLRDGSLSKTRRGGSSYPVRKKGGQVREES